MEIIPEYKIELARELRKRQTPSETRLWDALRRHRLQGLGFRRQHPMGRFIADFCCESAKLIVEIVEVDGGYHETQEQQELDAERAAHFTGRGYTVLRVSVVDVMANLPNVLERILAAVATSPHPLPLPPPPGDRRLRGEGSLIPNAASANGNIPQDAISGSGFCPSPPLSRPPGEGKGVGA